MEPGDFCLALSDRWVIGNSGAGNVPRLNFSCSLPDHARVLLIAAALVAFGVCPRTARAADENAVVAVCVQPSCQPGHCGGLIARGSGVAIGRDQTNGRLLILTAAHVVRDRNADSVVQVYVGQRWLTANVRAVTRKTPNWDLALLDVDYQAPWPCLALHPAEVGSGTQVNLCGYEGGLRWVHKRGLFGHRDSYWLYWNGATPKEGTSGGAVVANGTLVAIVSGYTTDSARLGVGQNSAAIAMFLQNALGYLPGQASNTPSAQAPTIPTPTPTPTPDVTLELRQQVAALKQELQLVKNRPITVEIFDPETGTVKSRSFPAGEPIRLKLPARREPNVGAS